MCMKFSMSLRFSYKKIVHAAEGDFISRNQMRMSFFDKNQ
ncbi:hypothetical protein ERHA54_50260 (plasmid) [Erwinia rhapontici]|nr:hypothetical protein ERHA54_50260 [Erwinia rhapontici]